MYFPDIGDEVTQAEIEHYSKVRVHYEGAIVPAWEMTQQGEGLGSEMTLIYRECDPEQDVFFTAEAVCLRVSDTSWVVVDMSAGYPALTDLDESRQKYRIDCIQSVLDKFSIKADLKDWLKQAGVIA